MLPGFKLLNSSQSSSRHKAAAIVMNCSASRRQQITVERQTNKRKLSEEPRRAAVSHDTVAASHAGNQLTGFDDEGIIKSRGAEFRFGGGGVSSQSDTSSSRSQRAVGPDVPPGEREDPGSPGGDAPDSTERRRDDDNVQKDLIVSTHLRWRISVTCSELNFNLAFVPAAPR